MKPILSILLLSVLLSAQTFAQSKMLYEKKVEHYKKVKNTGIILASTGAFFTCLGIWGVSSADWNTQNTSTGSSANTTDSEGVIGVAGLVIGVPLTITGIIISANASSKRKHYERALENMSLNLKWTPKQQDFSLVYRF